MRELSAVEGGVDAQMHACVFQWKEVEEWSVCESKWTDVAWRRVDDSNGTGMTKLESSSTAGFSFL